MNNECLVCFGPVESENQLPLKYCDCRVVAHERCWMRALRAMEGRRFCLICDLENWDRCWHREQNAAVRRVFLSILGIYFIIYLLLIIFNK